MLTNLLCRDSPLLRMAYHVEKLRIIQTAVRGYFARCRFQKLLTQVGVVLEFGPVLYSPLYCTLLDSTVLYSTLLYSTLLYSTAL